jgi:hypothetical protein
MAVRYFRQARSISPISPGARSRRPARRTSPTASPASCRTGSSLILNIGTTTEQVAHALRRHRDLMVVTNNLNVAMILHDAEGVDVVVSGGMVRKADGGIIGEAAVDLIRQFKVDFAVIGASAIDEEGTLLDFDYREVRIAQAILYQARKTILVADTTKFERARAGADRPADGHRHIHHRRAAAAFDRGNLRGRGGGTHHSGRYP